MNVTYPRILLPAIASLLLLGTASAGPVYQPPGSNLTLGDVTHGLRVQSASSNPAAAAADRARVQSAANSGLVFSVAAGLEYGNVQELFDLYDEITGGYKPSEPGTPSGPGQEPEPDKGIDVGRIIDELDPELRATIEAVGREVAAQAAVLAVIASEGYARAWVSADVPVVLNGDLWGGTWTTGINWSGSSKAFGATTPIEFDFDDALVKLEGALGDFLDGVAANPPEEIELSEDVLVAIDSVSRGVKLLLNNDSSLLTKATQTTELNLGYSRESWSNVSGSLFLGAEAKLYLMRLSRFSARFGDITDSEELFDAIDNANFQNDQGFGLDLGALWVGGNYQLGVQWTNINEPEFEYPEIDVTPYTDPVIINTIQRDQFYRMDSQVKVEASLFTDNRRWSAHLGFDANAATDPLGDDYQWATLSAAWTRPDSFLLPNVRVGWRQTLAGTELGFLSVGATMFRYINFDISSALDTVKISGTELPQGLMGSIGFHINW
jgi:hypothetical protein